MTPVYVLREQAAEQARVAAEQAAAKAKEATESAGKGVTGDGSEAADAALKEGEKGAGFFTGLWENAQKAAQDAQKSALEVCWEKSRALGVKQTNESITRQNRDKIQ